MHDSVQMCDVENPAILFQDTLIIIEKDMDVSDTLII